MTDELPLKRRGQDITFAQEIIAITWQYRISRVLMVVHRTGVFKRLGRAPATSAVIAAELKLDADMLERLLIGCAALDLVRREGEAWALTPKARTTLLPESALYQGDYIDHIVEIWGFWSDLEHILRGEKGASAFSASTARGRDNRSFILAMHNLAMAGRVAEVVAHLDLEGRRTLLDVGGGPGTYSMALCQQFPQLHSTIFDLPETLAITRERLAKFGMSDRVSLHPGNWDADEFPGGQDAVIMSNILHGARDHAEMKLAKAKRALNAGGLLIVQDFLLNDEKTGPLLPALFNVMVGAFSRKELAERIASAGFAQVKEAAMREESGQTLVTAVKRS